MVRITNPTPEPKKRPDIILEDTNQPDPTQRQNKNMKIQLRLTPAVEQQLRQYAEVKGTTVTDAVETIVTKKFHNKKINRQYFNLNKPSTLLVPKSINLFSHYANEQINLLANITETSTENYTITLFDKQAELFTNHPEDLEVVTIQQVNNAFDTYSNNNECYFTTYNLQEGENKFLNHIGLIVLIHEELTEDTLPKKIRLPIFVNVYDGELREARIISQGQAVKLAEEKNNLVLQQYLENISEVVQFENVDDLITLNNLLSDINYSLQQEVNQLKNEKLEAEADQQLQQRLNELEAENTELRNALNNVDDLVKDKLETMFKYAIEKAQTDSLLQENKSTHSGMDTPTKED